jgi:hypothetical protein
VNVPTALRNAMEEALPAMGNVSATSELTANTTATTPASMTKASVISTRSGKDGGPNTSVKGWRSSSNPNPSLRRPMGGVMDASDSKDE